MSTSQSSKAWDLSPVLELVNALSVSELNPPSSSAHAARSPAQVGLATTVDHEQHGQRKNSSGLGDFSRIWQYLGVSATSPDHEVHSNHGNAGKQEDFTSKHDYASDGAVRYGLPYRERKTVTWRDDTSVDDGAPASSPERDVDCGQRAKKLTKSQRKKKNRKERKAKDAMAGLWTVSESEADTNFIQTPARKASLHRPALEATNRHGSHSQRGDGNGKVGNSGTAEHAERIDRQASEPELPTTQDKSDHVVKEISKQTTQWPVPAKGKVFANGFLPSSVSPQPAAGRTVKSRESMFPHDTQEAVQAVQNAQAQLQNTNPSRLPYHQLQVIEPKIVRSGEDRHWALLLKLINEFPEDRRYLVSPMNMTTHNNDSSGIHLFVDASNIFIGFHDQLKRSRNIPLHARVPRVDLSFDALALLMERRRPIAKRTLVGSTPYLPAFAKAEAVGYECSILEKVYKARELTERQKFFQDRDASDPRTKLRAARESAQDGGGGYSSGGGHTSESGTAGKQYAPARMIEQGVDELLHMKMAQSLLDYDVPSTMVVATGDAAQAEYSDGFKAMIERALRKGWMVELVSWSKNVSSLYLRRDFQSTWGDRFKVIYLDDYAEELLDM